MPENSVLIVEDDEIITRVLLSMLRDGGFVLHTPVNSGEQVIEQVASYLFDDLFTGIYRSVKDKPPVTKHR